MHTAEAQHETICLESENTVACQASVTSWRIEIRQLAAQLTPKSRNNKAVYQVKTGNIAHGPRLSRDVLLRIKQQINTVKGQ